MDAVAQTLVSDDIFGRLESNVRSYCRNFPGVFATARGSWIYERGGRRVLDLLCGAGSLNYGHNDPAIVDEVLAYLKSGGLVHSLDLHTVAKEQFLFDFDEMVLKPRGYEYKIQFPGPAGTNAVEAALKLVRKVTGRRNIAAFKRGFHGVSLGSLAVTSNHKMRAAAGVPLDHVVFWPYPCQAAEHGDPISLIADSLAQLPKDQLPAAVIMEVVQGEGGLRYLHVEQGRRLVELCRQYQILVIVDDIQAGCGRTGTFFSFEHLGFVPDLVLLSKSLSGFGAPLSVVLIRPDLDVWLPGEHNGTFRGNNLAFVGGSAALSTYWVGDGFALSVRQKSEVLSAALESIAARYPELVQVRGRGLMTGLEFTDPSLATACSRKLFDRAIMVETCGDRDQTLKLLPPLNISDRELDFALDAISDVVDQLCSVGSVGVRL